MEFFPSTLTCPGTTCAKYCLSLLLLLLPSLLLLLVPSLLLLLVPSLLLLLVPSLLLLVPSLCVVGWCHHCCLPFTAAGAHVAETHKVMSSQYISEAVCLTEFLRVEDGHTTSTKVASEYTQVQLVCADLFRLTAPFLLAVNVCHNGQPWLKGEQQTSWLTGHLLIL